MQRTSPCSRLISTCVAFALSGMLILPAHGQSRREVQRTWQSAEQFDAAYRDRYLDSLSEPGTVRLTSRMVVADEMGAGYNDFQPIRGKTQARKTLILDSGDLTDATLLVGGSVSGCEIVVNGTVLEAEPLPRSYWHAEFERFEIPPALLEAGENEFVFRAREGGSGRIRIERSMAPDRSAVSGDGGHRWQSDRLGDGGYINGEFQVRLNIGRHAPQAWLESPVVDLSQLDPEQAPRAIPGAADWRVEELAVDAEMPEGTGVALFVRTGPTPDGDEESWTHWHAWPAERESLPMDRFVQWRLELATEHPQRTPVVRQVKLRTSAVPHASATAEGDAPTAGPRLIDSDNPAIVRSSYDFAYARHDGNARVLRERWALEDVLAGAESEQELAKLIALRQWVREQWHHGWDMGELSYIPSWDARVILTMAPQNLSLGMCTHYATVLVQSAQALGYPARSIFRDHALSEIWSNEHRKWIIMDAGADTNDQRRATYHLVRDGEPLNEMEVHRAYHVEHDWQDIEIVATNMSEGTDDVQEPFGEDREAMFEGMREIFMPLRNNFIDHREPEEPEHGQGHFKFLNHLYWKSEVTPDVPWTDYFTTREADLYWTINHAEIFLHRVPDRDDQLEVMLDTVTPNFTRYEVRLNGAGPWTELASAAGLEQVHAYPMKATGGCVAFRWPIAQGENVLEARPVNAAGVTGIVSRVTVELP